MARFNLKLPRHRPGADRPAAEAMTAEGAPGFLRGQRAELFLLAVSNMVGTDTFYEAAADRDARFRELVAAVAVADPDWFARFVPWLRTGALLRSASVVAALEGSRAQVAAGVPGSRAVVGAALQRADEPGEALAYWLGRHGRALPKPVKRGVADAVVRLYHERSLLRYDSDGDAVRFGDVIELTHPVARDARQGDLFRHALDRRHKRDNPLPESLTVLAARAELMALPVQRRREVTDPAVLGAAGMSWEA
ncbi:TROVE domain-containing protein, partial [Micromonospora sp. DH15]|nr:TROVE domain-containing protein [Micromonospora sp. DH15]